MSNNFHYWAQLVIIQQSGEISIAPIAGEQYIIGRTGGANDIPVDSPVVSSQHAMIVFTGSNEFCFVDLASRNGSAINGVNVLTDGVNPSEPISLTDGDVITLGGAGTDGAVTILFSVAYEKPIDWKNHVMKIGETVTLGRGTENTISVPDIMVSRRHAVIAVKESGVTVTDLHSHNGTILNGEILTGTQRFKSGSVLRMGNTKIFRMNSMLIYNSEAEEQEYQPAAEPVNRVSRQPAPEKRPRGNMQVDRRAAAKSAQYGANARRPLRPANRIGVQVKVEHISKEVACKRTEGQGNGRKKILDDISLVVNPGEFVAILGGSGSGKTTFMNCVNGFEPATSGRVLINGVDLYKNYQSVKSSIGYVPQQDIVYDNLTVKKMLTYSCKLRLPSDLTKTELEQRVNDVMTMVDLQKQKDTFIRKLSGGQRKRASIAVELVSDPTLFFLDEPTSGLDPEAETNLMHSLRLLSSSKGKTIIVITHTLQNIHLFDKIIFIAPGGHLCFYGDPESAKVFFDVDNLSEAYEKISGDIPRYVGQYNELVRGGVLQ